MAWRDRPRPVNRHHRPVGLAGAARARRQRHRHRSLARDGSLDAAAAQLTVQGAVVAADTNAGGVTLGAAGAVRYDRCAVQLALAVGARPSLAPFSLWHRLSR
jgi:hypothetical protein